MSMLSARVTHKPLVIAVALALGLGMGSAHAASITVTDGGDSGSPTTCTLRQAIEAANTDAVVGTCTAGLGVDSISFSGALANTTITLGGTELQVTDDLIITGSGQTLDANGASRVLAVDPYTSLTASNLTITGGATSGYDDGGGIYADDHATLTLSACSITGNNSSSDGGGIALDFYGTLILTDSTVSGNYAGNDGGGIYVDDDSIATVTNSIISGNHAAYDGGGIYVEEDSVLTVTDSTIRDNDAGYEGGGIYVEDDGILTVSNSTISGNHAGYEGGGIHVDDRGIVTVTNSTISGNSAGQEGGGIYVDNDNAVTVTNSTITGNHSDSAGGGIYSDGATGSITLQNTVLSGNTAPSDLDLGINTYGGGASVTAAASLLGTALSGTYPGNGNVFSDTPGLGALANNGGPTQTMLPLSGSPVLDAGDNSLIPMGVMYDQRGVGFPRIVGARVDIGGVEAAAAAAAPPTLVPAGSTWTLSLLGLLLGTLGFFGLRGRQPSP